MSCDTSGPARQAQHKTPAVVLQGVGKVFPASRPSLLDALHNRITHGFPALQDVSLTVHQGDTLGILGANGAGKSTLLQLIVGVLEPSSGWVTRHGRVAALLELGAGFNPLWTGRRNAEFYCMVQGCTRKQLPARLREIEAFADIGSFFDRPMRTYSSGMFMRVAFAAAMATDPDIFIVDEALAVGDSKFQKKCFGYFRDMQSRGKTIILVTHDAMLVNRFCTRGVVLDAGRVTMDGSARDAAAAYLRVVHGQDDADLSRHGSQPAGAMPETGPPGEDATDPGCRHFRWPPAAAAFRGRPHYNPDETVVGRSIGHIADLALVDETGALSGQPVAAGSRLTLIAQIVAQSDVERPHFGMMVTTGEDVIVIMLSNIMLGEPDVAVRAGEEMLVSFTFDLPLVRGDYFIDFGLAEAAAEDLDVLEWRRGVCHLAIANPSDVAGILDPGGVFRRSGREG